MHTRYQIDREFIELGATHILFSYYPGKYIPHTGTYTDGGVFSIHYFNCDKTEIGYWIPDLAPECGPNILEMPREWPVDKLSDLVALDVSH